MNNEEKRFKYLWEISERELMKMIRQMCKQHSLVGSVNRIYNIYETLAKLRKQAIEQIKNTEMFTP